MGSRPPLNLVTLHPVWLTPVCQPLSLLRSLNLDTALQVWSHKWWTEGKYHFSCGPAHYTLAESEAGLLHPKGTLLNPVHLVHLDKAAKLLCSQFVPGLCGSLGLFHPQSWILHLPLLKFKLLSNYFCRLTRSSWTVTVSSTISNRSQVFYFPQIFCEYIPFPYSCN